MSANVDLAVQAANNAALLRNQQGQQGPSGLPGPAGQDGANDGTTNYAWWTGELSDTEERYDLSHVHCSRRRLISKIKQGVRKYDDDRYTQLILISSFFENIELQYRT